MGKLVDDEVLDAALQHLEDHVDWISVCEGAPTTYEHAHSNKGSGAGKALAHSVTPTFTGPTNGDTNGRKTTIDEEPANTIDVSGNSDHVALVRTDTSKLLYATTCTLQALVAAGTVTIPAWDIEIADPS
jgi:hypothetical protein